MQDSALSIPRTSTTSRATSLVPRAGTVDTALLALDVLIPTVAKGVIVRRPWVLAVAERLNLDRRAVRRMQKLRHHYGSGPLLFQFPGRRLAVVFRAEDVHRVLGETPAPFSTANREKVAALSHFEPKSSLISSGADRVDRRRFNEEALEAGRPEHHLAESFVRVVESEAAAIVRAARVRGELTWDAFAMGWFRMVRRIVFGEAAAEDHELSRMTYQLRSAANWAFARPHRTDLRRRFLNRIGEYLRRAGPGSLAGTVANIHVTARTAPEQQIPQWLFAFDPAGMATFRALALLAAHPEESALARAEITAEGPLEGPTPYLRATVLESLRLWPTTPLLLRETTADTVWEHGVIPANTGVLIFTPFFHRDSERLSYADRFAPELWMNDHAEKAAPLIPFSEGLACVRAGNWCCCWRRPCSRRFSGSAMCGWRSRRSCARTNRCRRR